AAGKPGTNSETTVYAQVSTLQGDATAGVWRSDTSGASWADASGTLGNPTLVSARGRMDCGTVDSAHGQAYYNLAIAVDPDDDNHVIVGGNLCGMRTLAGKMGSPVWENISHWLPSGGSGDTSAGRLDYVHADWHA